MGGGNLLKNTETPAPWPRKPSLVDAILLSHEDHPDNLDDFGRQLLSGRQFLPPLME
jgi:hypothetical protein